MQERKREKESARENLVALAPPALAVNRVGARATADAADDPVGAHGQEVSILTLKVKDEPLWALAVSAVSKERAELGDRNLSLVLTAEFGDYGVIKRRLLQLPNRELGLVHSGDFQAQELGPEVFPHPDNSRLVEILLGGGEGGLSRHLDGADDG